MMSITISTHFGHKAVRGHNIRNSRTVANQPHIDPYGHHEAWLDVKPRDAYKMIFGAAVDAYNASQTRSDRTIDNYFAKIQKSATQHTVYEELVAVGSRDNAPPPEVGRAILMEYAKTWQNRNRNMRLIGVYYHADEQGVPHLHMDFVPVATECKRGPAVQNSYNKALSAMGYHGRNAGAQWFHAENSALEDICRAHNLDVAHPQAGKSVQHRDTQTYKSDTMKQLEAAVAAERGRRVMDDDEISL